MANENIFFYDNAKLKSYTTAELLELALQRIQSSHSDLINFYEQMADMFERRREFDSMRPVGSL